MKKHIPILVVILMIFSTCTEKEMDVVSKVRDNPLDAPAKFILADVITATSFSGVGQDADLFASVYVEHETGISDQLWRAETRAGEPTQSSTYNNLWNSLYGTLQSAREVIAKCSAGGTEEGNNLTKGAGEVMAAYNSALLTDLYGDVPWSQAALPTMNGIIQYTNPNIDSQEQIYKGIMDYINAAIVDIPKGDNSLATGALDDHDFLYNGDASLWLKFAYGLKARYTMRLLDRTTDRNAALNSVIDCVNHSFASADEQAAFAIYGGSQVNPFFAIEFYKKLLGASQSLAQKLIERHDPRIRRVFSSADWVQIKGPDDPVYQPAPNQTADQKKGYYNLSIFTFSQQAPTLLLSYHEILFLKAEALARLGRTSEAATVLKSAVIAGIANTEKSVMYAFTASTPRSGGGSVDQTTLPITPTEAASYFDAQVRPLFDTNPVKEVMNQKYLAFFGASGESTETYNDIRRLKALGEGNYITLANTLLFPLRFAYGNSDVVTNPNVQQAYGNGQYVYTELVWWAGGTR